MHGPRIETYGVTALEGLTEANQDRPFADLVTPLIPAAQRLAYGMLQNTHDCEDAVQEATFKAWRAFPRLREGSNLRAWFLTIVANECRQRRRNRWWSILKLGTTPIEDSTPSGSDVFTSVLGNMDWQRDPRCPGLLRHSARWDQLQRRGR